MSTDNCTYYGSEPSILYGYAARRIGKGLDVTICTPSITNPIVFDVEGEHADSRSETHLGYQLQQARDAVVIYTDVSQMPSHLRENLRSSCNLVDYDRVQFEMCVGASDVMLPNAEYDGDQVREVNIQQNNRCDHEFGSSLDFLQSILGYPPP
mgnify:CR=1 FL=1